MLETIVLLVLGCRTPGQPGGPAKHNSRGVWNAVWLPSHSSRKTPNRYDVGKTNTVRHADSRKVWWECKLLQVMQGMQGFFGDVSVEGAPKIAAMELSRCARQLLDW